MKKNLKKSLSVIIMTLIMSALLIGCGRKDKDEIIVNEAELLEEQTPLPSVEGAEIIYMDEEDEIAIPVPEQNNYDAADIPIVNQNALQIVFLGDDNLDNNRNSTGVASLVGEKIDATIYNIAIAGSNVAFIEDDGISTDNINMLNARSLVGITGILAGHNDADGLGEIRAAELIDEINIEKTDYFVIMYNANDFFHRIPLDTEDFDEGVYTYVGAFRRAVIYLREAAPYADIIICTPHYSLFFDENNIYLGDGNILHNGIGTLNDYRGKAEHTAKYYKTIYVDSYYGMGIDGYSAEYLLDRGYYLSEEGREVFADYLVRIIKANEEP